MALLAPTLADQDSEDYDPPIPSSQRRGDLFSDQMIKCGVCGKLGHWMWSETTCLFLSERRGSYLCHSCHRAHLDMLPRPSYEHRQAKRKLDYGLDDAAPERWPAARLMCPECKTIERFVLWKEGISLFGQCSSADQGPRTCFKTFAIGNKLAAELLKWKGDWSGFGANPESARIRVQYIYDWPVK